MPIGKVTASSSANDFRPMALLSFISRALKKIAHTQVQECLNAKNLLDALQTVFGLSSSTEDALLRLTHDLRSGIDKRCLMLVLPFDFSKAFVTISASKLLRKLKKLGFFRTVLLWIKSYSFGRKRAIMRIDGDSEWRYTNMGVPQGPVLGSLLFSLCIKHILYADYLQVSTRFDKNDLLDGINTLSNVAGALRNGRLQIISVSI